MTRYNILWGILHGGPFNLMQDWVRSSSEKYGRDGRDGEVKAVLPETDDSIRGWLTESLVQMALSSSYGKRILKLDPANTYSSDLSPKTDRLFTTRPNIQDGVIPTVIIEKTPEYTGVYSRAVSMTALSGLSGSDFDSLINETITCRYVSADGLSSVVQTVFSDGVATIPFGTGRVTVMGVTKRCLRNNGVYIPFDITYKALPRESPVGILKRRIPSDDIREAAGLFCWETLERHA